jgi:hypothetical protein
MLSLTHGTPPVTWPVLVATQPEPSNTKEEETTAKKVLIFIIFISATMQIPAAPAVKH